MTTETRADFARRMGWNRSSVTRAVQDGRVVLLDGLVDVDASLAKIDALASPYAHHRAHVQQLEEARHAKTPTASAVAAVMHAYAPLVVSVEGINNAPDVRQAAAQGAREAISRLAASNVEDLPQAEGIEALNLRLKRAEANKREEEAKTAKLQRQILEGEYVHVDTVRFALKDHSAQIVGMHENVADRLTPLIDPLRSYEEKHSAISEFMADLQRDIHDSSERSKRMLGKNE